jgi:hypothetical protein
MSVAVTSLPVPLSPLISTVLSLFWITRRNSNTARMRPLAPTTTESDGIVGIMTASHDSERLEFRDGFAERRLHAEMQRHVGARTARAHASQPDVGGVAVDADDDDVAAIRLKERPHEADHGFHLFSGHPREPKGNRCARKPATKT